MTTTKKLRPEELASMVIEFLATADACRVFQTDGTMLSKMRSPEIDGRDNHRKSPFERTGDIIRAIRIEIDDAGDSHREDRMRKGQECLELIGKYFAQLCRGKFLNEELARRMSGIFS